MKLTTEEKRIKIAKACKWKKVGWYGDELHTHLSGLHPLGGRHDLPGYFNKLEDIRGAVLLLDKTIRNKDVSLADEYTQTLRRMFSHPGGVEHIWCEFDYINATADMRAEAFGLTLGLWKEGE